MYTRVRSFSTLQTISFKMFMAYLLAIVGGSRGSRFYTSALEQTDVVDNHSADQGEAEAMQDLGERPGKHYQEEDAAISSDLPSDLALRRRSCIKEAHLKGDKTYFECNSGCCCQGPQKMICVAVKNMCETDCRKCQSG